MKALPFGSQATYYPGTEKKIYNRYFTNSSTACLAKCFLVYLDKRVFLSIKLKDNNRARIISYNQMIPIGLETKNYKIIIYPREPECLHTPY
jgi:hypothetical protein